MNSTTLSLIQSLIQSIQLVLDRLRSLQVEAGSQAVVQKEGIEIKLVAGSVTSASLMPNSSGGRLVSNIARSPLYLMPTTSVPLVNTSTVIGSNSPGAGLLGVVLTLKSLRVVGSPSANNLPASQKKSLASRSNAPLMSNISSLFLSTIILAPGLSGSS